MSARVVYLLPNGQFGQFDEPRLATASERHRMVVPPPVTVTRTTTSPSKPLPIASAG